MGKEKRMNLETRKPGKEKGSDGILVSWLPDNPLK
jgi:hypothetical protein